MKNKGGYTHQRNQGRRQNQHELRAYTAKNSFTETDYMDRMRDGCVEKVKNIN